MSDDFIDLMQTSKSPESSPDESDPGPSQRSGFAFLIAIVFIVAIGILFESLKDRPGGIQIVAMVAYTVAIPYIASNRFLNPVPWALMNRFRGRFLLVHALALAVVYGITTWAFAVKAQLPAWFTIEGRRRRVSFFDLSLVGIILILAFCECFWISSHEDKEGSDN